MKKRRILILISVLAALVFCDLLFSNLQWFSARGTETTELNLKDAALHGATRSDDGVLMKKTSYVVFENVDLPVELVSIEVTSAGFEKFELKLSSSDDGNKMSYRTYVDARIYTDEPGYFSVHSSGNLRNLRIECIDGKPFVLKSVTLNAVPPIRFHYVRVGLLFGLVLLLDLLFRKKLWKTIYIESSAGHRLAVSFSLFFSLIIVLLCCGGAGARSFPIKDPNPNAYEQLFTSILDGRVNIDVDCDTDALEKLEDPYDYTERNQVMDKFGSFWDRAYYQGNFYCYFGIAPIFVCFFPVFLVTGGTLVPNLTMATMMVLLGAVAGFYALLLALIRYFRMRVPVALLVLSVPTLVFASLLPMIATSADMYYLPIASALCFTSLALNCGLRASLCDRKGKRITLFSLSGVCTVLAVASRPTIALYCALLLPVFIGVLTEKGRTAGNKLSSAAAYLVPVAFGALGIMYYNAIRFGSPLEFGTTYQLTMSDIAYNRPRLDLLAETFAHYFLQYPDITGQFPYLKPAHLGLNTYGSYFYSTGSLGALCFPVTWAAVGLGFSTKKQPIKKAFCLLALGLPILVAFLDLCVGGVNIRYLSDILFPLVLLGNLVLLEAGGKAAETLSEDGVSFRVTLLIALPMVLSMIMGTVLIFANERNWIASGNPFIFRLFELLFSF